MTVLAFDLGIRLGEFELEIDQNLPLGGVTALFGPSGSGKTTLLRIIAGLEPRARGRISFGDEVWQKDADGQFVPPHERGVGYVFQDARLFPHLSVEGNLRYAERRSRATGGKRIDFSDVVEALDLAPLLGRDTLALSGGERQRVATGRTLLTRPRLLLMDEPLAALDFARKAEILPYIERLPDTFALPVIYVSHAIDEVARLAEHVIVLGGGRKVAEGDVPEIFERLDLRPATGRFEAGVVLAAQVVSHDPTYHLTTLDHHGQRIVMPMAELPIGAGVRLRIRARDVALATRRPEEISVRNILTGTIAEIAEEPDTAFAETLVDIGGAGVRARLTRAAVADLDLKPGRAVFVLVKSIAFDRRSLAATPSLRLSDEEE